MLLADYHTHTRYSHGVGTVEDNVKAAIGRNLQRIAISEHNAGHVFYGVRGGAWKSLRAEIDRMNRVYGNQIEVLMGVEANLIGFGKTDLPADTSMFDCILLGYHKGVLPRDGCSWRWFVGAVTGNSERYARTNAQALCAAIEKHRGLMAVSHPGAYVPMDISYLAQAATAYSVALELNENHQSMTIDQIQCAASMGVRFLANSDAHRPEDVGVVTHAIAAAQAADVMSLVDNWT